MKTNRQPLSSIVAYVGGLKGRIHSIPTTRIDSWNNLSQSIRSRPSWPPHAGQPDWSRHLGGHAPVMAWLLLGLGVGVVSQVIPLLIFPKGLGQIGALFFQIALLAGFGAPLFWRYGVEILIEKKAPLKADMRLALRLGCIFFSLTATAMVPLLILGHEAYHEWYVGGAHLISPTSTDFTFYSLLPMTSLIEHNISVVATYFLLGLLFRQLGAIIVIAYNALAWGVAFGGAGITLAAADPIWLLIGPLALLPHLTFEVFGFCLAGVAGAMLQWTIRTTEWQSRIQHWALKRVLVIICMCATAMPVAAWLETHWAVAICGLAQPDETIEDESMLPIGNHSQQGISSTAAQSQRALPSADTNEPQAPVFNAPQ